LVAKLAAYPWFHGNAVPKYDSGQHGSPTKWKQTYASTLVSKWTRSVCTDAIAIRAAARSAVEMQLELGCESVLLAAPLTTMVSQTLQPETDWMDAGIDACKELGVIKPVYATIAIAEDTLQHPPLNNPLVHSFSTQIASREALTGAYLLLEQSDPNDYFWLSRNPLSSVLTIIDDLNRGANKKVIVNYLGTFGLVARAVGAEVWSSGYYLSQRKFSRRGKQGRAHPRYHSMALASDIGLKDDIERLYKAGLGHTLMTPSSADAVLRSALAAGKSPKDVAEWEYTQSNVAAATAHYIELTSRAEHELAAKNPGDRVTWVHTWLSKAVANVALINQRATLESTELLHQRIWLEVFEEWRNYAKQ
jgi:hypothetical protein